MGISATNLSTGETVAVNGDVRFPTASLIKVAVMVEVYSVATRRSRCTTRTKRVTRPYR
jgi:beta-lactamase class A